MSVWDGEVPKTEGALQECLADLLAGRYGEETLSNFLGEIKNARTLSEAGIFGTDSGVVLELTNGAVFHLVVRTQAEPPELEECIDCPNYVGKCGGCARPRPFHPLAVGRVPRKFVTKYGSVGVTQMPDLSKLGPPPAMFKPKDQHICALAVCRRCDAPLGVRCVTTRAKTLGIVGNQLPQSHRCRVREATAVARAILAAEAKAR